MSNLLTACCCGDGPVIPPGNCGVTTYCYEEEDIKPELISWSTTGTKPQAQAAGTAVRQQTNATSTVSNLIQTNLTQPANTTTFLNRWRWTFVMDWTLSSGDVGGTATGCGCGSNSPPNPYVYSTFSGTKQFTVDLHCNGGTSFNAIRVANSISAGSFIQPCQLGQGAGGFFNVHDTGFVSFPIESQNETCEELKSRIFTIETWIKLQGGIYSGCPNSAPTGLHKIQLNFKYR